MQENLNEKEEKANYLLDNLFKEYGKNNEAIEINFRSIVDWIHPNTRSTHFIHPYPAKLLMQIPNFFLTNNILSQENDLVLDPFCGSGTVLLESNLNNRRAYGIDINPIAALISKVKTTNFNITKIKRDKEKILLSERKENTIPDVVNIDYWFSPRIIIELSKILYAIYQLEDNTNKSFFMVCLSVCARKLSFADPNVSVPVKLKIRSTKSNEYNSRVVNHNEFIQNVNVLDHFSKTVDNCIELIKRNENIIFESEVICDDIRYFVPENQKFDLIITSPPYAGAQKYIRATSLNLGWLGLCSKENLHKIENNTVGREHYSRTTINNFQETGLIEADKLLNQVYEKNPLRARIASNYLLEMKRSIKNATMNLKSQGYFVLIIGNNVVCGKEFDTQSYLEQIMVEMGFTTKLKMFDTIKSRGLMTKRNKTASLITREWVIVTQKN